MGDPGAITLATILRESLAQTLRFVAWHLDMGIAHIALYFDDPDDPAIAILKRQQNVSCTPCTAEFWVSMGLSSDMPFVKRQNAVLSRAYSAAETPWFLAVDADEFLYLRDGDLASFARTLPDATRAVRFVTAEAVQQEEGVWWYRIPINRGALHRVYGSETAQLLAPRLGLVGHHVGKSLTRTGLTVGRVRQHWVADRDGQPICDATISPSAASALLHFVDQGYESWRAKFEWRSSGWGLNPRIQQKVRDAGTKDFEVFCQSLYAQLHRLSATQVARLQAEGGCFSVALDFDTSARRRFGDKAG